MTIKQLIDISVNEDRIVTATFTQNRFDELALLSDDYTSYTHAAGLSETHEFWGVSDTGSDWRVHLESSD